MNPRGLPITIALSCVLPFSCSKQKESEPKVEQVTAAKPHLPGAEAYSDKLVAELLALVQSKGADYKARTRHLNADGSPRYTNRLVKEPSPYLQQHAHNPVNWYPWGDEAFEAAKRLDRPVLLSIGYSTCHWCHVMEEESFEDEETARYLNENYIAIKVDREERPDVDSIYMAAIHAMGQSGGWPLNVWLTPDRRPFYGGTYFPPEDGRGRPAFRTILSKIKEKFDNDRDGLLRASSEVVTRIEQMAKPAAGSTSIPGEDVLTMAATQFASAFDPVYGGRKAGGRGNKFPSSMPVRFLLRSYLRNGDKKFLDMATLTLDKMAAGGMYDQAGGGFHRYSTDPKWLVPHFEKMLYDNALLVPSYVEAFQLTGKARHKKVARHILAYVAREMRAPGGGFYSASDADSEGPGGEREEGYYFTWTPEELVEVLGADRARLAQAYWGVHKGGNFEGRSILHVTTPLAEIATKQGLSLSEAERVIDEAAEALYQARQKRPAPARDTKVLVAWNGLMVSAYAIAGRALGPDEQRELDYLAIASKAADFVLSEMRKDGRLLRSYQGGKAHLMAYVEDYSFFTAGLLDLYTASGEQRWLDSAIELQEQLDLHYADTAGAYFMTADDHESLLTREKPASDGAIPSGNSFAIANLQRLFELTSDNKYRDSAEAGLRAFGETLKRGPTGLSELLLAVDFHVAAVKQIVIVSPVGGDPTPFRKAVAEHYLPNHIYVETTEGVSLEKLATRIPLLKSKIAIGGTVTAYVCQDSHCELPTGDISVFRKQIGAVNSL